MEDRLACVSADVHADIETRHVGGNFQDLVPHVGQQPLGSIALGPMQGEPVGYVALGNDQGVQRRHWMSVADRVTKCVVCNDPVTRHITEQASDLALSVGLGHAPEISIVTIPLGCIAGVAKRLKIEMVVSAATVSGDYVIDFQGLLVSRNSAKCATEVCLLEHLVAQCAGQIAV